MVFSSFDNIKVAAIAAAVSENIRSIEELKEVEDERMIDKFIKNTGIKSIHKSDFEHTASDYGVKAAEAIKNAGKFKPEEIGVLIFISQTPDYRAPSTACAIHSRMGLSKSCIAYDVNLGCSGFVYGLNMAAALLKASSAEKALVIVGDTLARGRVNDKSAAKGSNTDFLFGDATAAILLEKDETSKLDIGLMSDGNGFKAMAGPYGGWRHPLGPDRIPGDDIGIFNFSISEVPAIVTEFLDKTGKTMEEYDALVLHQSNKMIIKQLAKKLKVPMEKVPMTLDRFGNTSGASVPLTIVDSYGEDNEGKVNLLTCGYGVGLSWGVASFEIDKASILPLEIGAESYDDGYMEYES